MDSIIVAKEGKQLGPYNLEQARFLLSQGFLSPSDLTWAPGFATWVPLSSVLTPALVVAEPAGAPAISVPPALPTMLTPAAVKPPGRGIRIWDIVWCVVGIIVVQKFGPRWIVVPVGSVGGLIVAYFGCAAIPSLRQAFYALVPASKANFSEFGCAAVALGLALLSLFIWVPLFTFSSWIFWSEVSVGPVILWFVNTCLFGYSFFMTRRLTKAAAEAPNHALQRTAPAVTAPASTTTLPPAAQVPRQPPQSLSL